VTDAISDPAGAHQAYLDAIETQPPSIGRPHEEPAVQLAPEADGPSPSAVEHVEEMLTVEWAKLSEALPALQLWAAESARRVRDTKAEMERVRRLLAAHKRLKNPIRRRK
jgi:hypothetical protein